MSPDRMAAEKYYEEIRSKDAALQAIEERAIAYLKQLSGYDAFNVGSFGLLLNLPNSDLDLAIGVPPDDMQRTLDLLKGPLFYKIQRQSSKTTTRHVFTFTLDGVEIDLGVLPNTDAVLLEEGLRRCREDMSRDERIDHVWEKRRLKESGDRQAYAELKLLPYAKYCPTFIWVPIL